MNESNEAVEAFIKRWQGREGGAERANYGMYLTELCDVIGVHRPEPAQATTAENDYVFERAVKLRGAEESISTGRIDLYKRGCFVLEAKQSRQAGQLKEVVVVDQPGLFGEQLPRGRRDAKRAWDVLMQNARMQAERYAKALPAKDGWPPFILICDVGHVIEVFADFSGQGKNYTQFPDRQSFRIYLEDLREAPVRERLRLIWTKPESLDPARQTARVTREIAEGLAQVSRALEKQKHSPETVAMFLMRCLFTMFAESVALLPEGGFSEILRRCESDPDLFPELVEQFWGVMDTGGFAFALEKRVRRFNGAFFKDRTVIPLGREEIGELRQAATKDWKDVDPSIFGTLLEQALDAAERKNLGAHYTPRAYVERLVVTTVIAPLREEWEVVQSTAERQRAETRNADAIATVAGFHARLSAIRILDPACGTGNFLYVSLELMKRLEGEVLEVLADLGGQEALSELEGHIVDPHQFLGLEINPRAAAIAELVLWIGYLQWFKRTQTGQPSEPILRAFKNIRVEDAVLTRPNWPEAEYIVGNPPFIGGKDVRARLKASYVKALWAANPQVNESADFVMYWWDHAAELLVAKDTKLKRFGFVTTNSITQVFQRRVVQRHLDGKKPISLVMAVDDHPWTKATKDAAAVRIAMTVAEAGRHEGDLFAVESEAALASDAPQIALSKQHGRINADLTVGVDVAATSLLRANEGLCSRGVSLHGSGFIVTRKQAEHLGLVQAPDLHLHIRDYRNGRDLTARSRGSMVIDLFGLKAEEVRKRFPQVYQHLLVTVKPARQKQYDESPTKDAKGYLESWWIFGKPRQELRPALFGLSRYIATVETAKHRVFQFLNADVLPDNKVLAIASARSFHLGVLSSRFHAEWALRAGGWLGIGNDPVYVKSRCFDPFCFPVSGEQQVREVENVAEELDAHRKQVLAAHPQLTLTGLYNVRERVRAGVTPNNMDASERRIFDDGLVLILNELHDQLDVAVAAAYGWDVALPEAEVLGRLVALNKERAAEEGRGIVKWLRPDYQIPRFGSAAEKLDLAGEMRDVVPGIAARRGFPADEVAQTAEVVAALAGAAAPMTARDIQGSFKQGRNVRPKVDAVLAGLVRMGIVAASGKGFSLRRGAQF